MNSMQCDLIICDVNVVAWNNRVNGDWPLSCCVDVSAGNVVDVVRGPGGDDWMWAAGCDDHVCIPNVKPWEDARMPCEK